MFSNSNFSKSFKFIKRGDSVKCIIAQSATDTFSVLVFGFPRPVCISPFHPRFFSWRRLRANEISDNENEDKRERARTGDQEEEIER